MPKNISIAAVMFLAERSANFMGLMDDTRSISSQIKLSSISSSES